MMRTFQTRIHTSPEVEALLQEYATRFSKAKHALFQKLLAAGKDRGQLNNLKREFCGKRGFTSRQYNALRVEVAGKIDGLRELQKLRVKEMSEKVAVLSVPPEKRKRRKKQKARSPETPFQQHQRHRRLSSIQQKLSNLKSDITEGKVRIAFGSKKLFNAQHHLDENGYENHAGWKADWVKSRENQFFVLGSGDETAGCQGCVATAEEEGTVQLSLRLPKESTSKHVVLQGLTFNVGDTLLRTAIEKTRTAEGKGVALSYRFVRDEKGWRAFVSFDLPDVPILSVKNSGRVGVDLNADHLAVAEIDRHGNVVSRTVIPLHTPGKTTHQARALIGDAVKQVVELAVKTKKPITVEKLDFQRKKATLRGDGGPRYARMLSSLAYANILGTIRSRAFDAGIEAFEVNPAYTSVIGEHLFQRRYGMSRHQGAAVAIGRRSMNFLERLPSSLHVTLPSTCKDRRRHVWGQWAVVARRKAALTALPTSRKSTSTSPAGNRKARGVKPGPQGAGQVGRTGENPVGESCPSLFGVRT